MGKRNRYRDHIDPEYRRWGRTYRSFPGVSECARLILAHKATGTWADIVANELAENAHENLEELIATFRKHRSDAVGMFVLMALEIAAIPASVNFLSGLLEEGEWRFVPYARRALLAIDTPESRAAVLRSTQLDNQALHVRADDSETHGSDTEGRGS